MNPSRAAGIGLLVATGLLVAVYALVWRAGAAEMRRSISTWADDQRAEGVDVSWSTLKVEGFPFRLRGVLTAPAIAYEESRLSWRADALRIDASLFAPDALGFSSRGAQRLSLGGAGEWSLSAPDGAARIRSRPRGLWELDVRSGPSRLERLDGAGLVVTQSTRLSVAPDPDDPARIVLRLIMDGLDIEAEDAAAQFEAVLADFALSRADLLVEAGADAWRAAGGAVDIERFALDSEGARLAARGTLGLDADGYPAGALAAEIADPGGLAVLLGRAGVLRGEDVEAARAGLTLAAIAGGGRIRGPLKLEQGEARIAGVRLAQLPKIVAPAVDYP